jgi:death-on-curing protein
LIRNRGFFDGKKRVAHAAMEVFLVVNAMEIRATVNDQERLMLSLAAGEFSREALPDSNRSVPVRFRLRAQI